jgi:hypothetical protein
MMSTFLRLRRAVFVAAVACCVALTISGCAPSGARAVLSGKVTYHGAPVPGQLTLRTTASGAAVDYPVVIGAEGKFTASGIPDGVYLVAVTPVAVNAVHPYAVRPGLSSKAGLASNPGNFTTVLKHVDIPLKYLQPETSGLRWEVKDGGRTKDFALAD